MANIDKELEQETYEKYEKDLKLKLVEYTEQQEIQAQTSEAFYIWNDDPNMIIEFTSEDDLDDHTFTRFLDWFMFDFKTFDTRKRVVQLFYENEFNNLEKPERELLLDWMKSPLGFFELKNKEGNDCYLTDIFTGKDLVVRDKNASKNAEISDILFARPLKTGYHYYFSGAISIYPHIFKQAIIDSFNKEFSEYRKEHGQNSSIEQFMRDWGYIISNDLEDVVRHPQFLTKDGEEFIVSSATYHCSDPEVAACRLLGISNIREITDSSSGLKAFLLEDGENGVSANIEIDDSTLTLKTNSKNKLEKAKSLIESNLQGYIEHIEDRFKELNSFVKQETEQTNRKEQLPSDNISDEELDTEMENYYDNWINTPLDALGGITPLKAMETESGKEKLEEVLKQLEDIYDHARNVGEPYYDVRKLRDKLKQSVDQ